MGKRIIAHLWMWGIMAAGASLSFLIFPAKLLLPRSDIFVFAGLILLAAFWLYNISGSIFTRSYASLTSLDMKHIAESGDYGKVVHPTCITLCIIAWGIFFIYPDLRILFSDIWFVSVIYFWIKIEGGTFIPKPKKDIYDSPDPML
jgi:hypothetical protein